MLIMMILTLFNCIGSLRSRGLSIQRQRVRERLAAVDPVGTMIRTRHAIRRRVYYVRGPNHLWYVLQ